MRILRIDNYRIEVPLIEIIEQLRAGLTNGKLKEVKSWTEGEHNIVVTCPHHSGGHETHAAMNVYVGNDSNIPYGYCKCWACDFSSSFVYFVAECFESSEAFAKKWLVDKFGILSEAAVFTEEDINIKPRKKATSMSSTFLDHLQNWHPYLGERKLSRDVCELFKVKYDPKTSQIVFPCFNTRGDLVMAPRRSILYKNFYLDSKQEKPVYCLDYIIKNNITAALLCEGPFDVLTSYTYGYPAIGTFGKPSPEQINAINKSPIKILYLGFDNDRAGHQMTSAIKAGLAPRIITKEVDWGIGKKDPNELVYEEFKRIIEKAKNS